MANVISRIREQWILLEHFFISYELEKNADLPHSITSQMTDSKKIYFSFPAYILNSTNKINVEFQSESPKIQILFNFIKPQNYQDILSNKIDFITENFS